ESDRQGAGLLSDAGVAAAAAGSVEPARDDRPGPGGSRLRAGWVPVPWPGLAGRVLIGVPDVTIVLRVRHRRQLRPPRRLGAALGPHLTRLILRSGPGGLLLAFV